MSQHDFDIANQGFAAFRADLNNALKALGSLSSGTAEPATTYANQLWYETDTNILHIRNEANSAWLDLMVIDQTTGSPSFTAGNVGIGTTSPASIVGGTDTSPVLSIGGTDTTLTTGDKAGSVSFITNDTSYTGTYADGVTAEIASVATTVSGANYGLAFYTGHVGDSRSERMRITSTGLGIGTDAPAAKLEVRSPANSVSFITGGSSADRSLRITSAIAGGANSKLHQISAGSAAETDGVLALATNETERMRIDASGVGIGTAPNAKLHVVRDLPTTNVGTVALFDRTTSTGEVMRFLKDGGTSGAIGVGTSAMYIGSGDTNLTFSPAGDAIVPSGTDGATRSGVIDLGNSGNRWDTIFATVGTINTSDRTEKQDIEELNDAERRVAVACKGLLRKYRLKSAVALKGEDARIHFGIIAQDLQDAFTAEGLDAGRYGMFIHSTWTDEETGEEKSLMGVRYSELLAFMISVL